MFDTRFWNRVDKTAGCWLWKGSKTRTGYGNLQIEAGKWDYAHRVSYRLAHGEIPPGRVIDHLCRVRNCVNPDHLEAVTQAVNVQRGARSYSFNGRCTSGKHDMSAPDSWRAIGSGRTCRTCDRESQARGYELVQAASSALGMPITHYLAKYGKSAKTARSFLKEASA